MPPQADLRPPANKWIIAATVIVASFVAVMDISIVNVAMPQMQGALGVTLDSITWVAVAYSISEILLVTLAAWLSSRLGRTRFFLISFALFTATSIPCGLSRSLGSMLFWRILQGMGAGGLIPISMAIMLETFPKHERGMAMSVYSMGVTLATSLGPVIGGWLTDSYGWPFIFFINVPIGIVGLIAAKRVLRDPPYLKRSSTEVDTVGIGLLAIGLTSLQVFLERGERERWFDSRLIAWAAIVAAVSIILLVWWELRAPNPIINLRLLASRPFLAGCGLAFIFGVTLFGSSFILPVFLQLVQGYSVLGSGIVQLPRSLSMMAMTFAAGRLYNHLDSRLLMGFGVLLMTVGYYDMSGFSPETGFVAVLPSLVLTGAGMACMFGTMSAAVMRTVPLQLMTSATSLYILARRIGGNVGYALTASQVEHRTEFHRARLVDHITPYDPAVQSALDATTAQLLQAGVPLGKAYDGAVRVLAGATQRQAAVLAYNDVFWLMAALLVIGLPLLLPLGRETPTAGK